MKAWYTPLSIIAHWHCYQFSAYNGLHQFTSPLIAYNHTTNTKHHTKGPSQITKKLTCSFGPIHTNQSLFLYQLSINQLIKQEISANLFKTFLQAIKCKKDPPCKFREYKQERDKIANLQE
jgi:hypothetical protein